MKIDNETLLGSYLAHFQSLARTLAVLDFEMSCHPEAERIRIFPSKRAEIMAQWDDLRADLLELLELPLKSFGELAGKGAFHLDVSVVAGPRCLRWNMRKIKKLADRHRMKNPEFTLLAGWDIVANRRSEDEISKKPWVRI